MAYSHEYLPIRRLNISKKSLSSTSGVAVHGILLKIDAPKIHSINFSNAFVRCNDRKLELCVISSLLFSYPKPKHLSAPLPNSPSKKRLSTYVFLIKIPRSCEVRLNLNMAYKFLVDSQLRSLKVRIIRLQSRLY